MNCFDARRALLTDPARLPESIADHVSQCRRCAREAAQIRRLDRRVAEVARVPVPEGLNDRLKMAGPQPMRRRLLPWGGGAALAAGLGHQVHDALHEFDFTSWSGLACVGICAIVVASILERHGPVLRRRIIAWRERFAEWDY